MTRPARASAPQLALFDFDFRPGVTAPAVFAPGDIVRQRHGGIGHAQTAFPFWQVMGEHPSSRPVRRLWTCRAVPFSAYPDAIWVFESGALVPTGLSWRVPTHHEIEMWAKAAWGINTFTAKINAQPDDTTFLHRSEWERVGRPGEVAREHPYLAGVYVRLPRFPEEAELLALLGDRPWQRGLLTRHAPFFQEGAA